MNKRMNIILMLTVLVLGGVFAAQWYGKRMMNEYFSTMGQAPVTVSSSDAVIARWSSSVSAVGSLQAVQGTELSTEVSGIVEAIHFKNGAKVKAGDVIASLNKAADQAQLQSLEASARLAEIERDRVESLLKLKSIAKAQFDKLNTELDRAAALVNAQRAILEQKRIRAPFDGRLGIRHINIGQFISAGDPIIALQAIDQLYLNFTLPEQWYSRVSVGQSVELIIDALNGETFTGKLTAIEPSIKQTTRNFDIQATVDNKERSLRAGMFARVQVSFGDATDQVIIPRTAISFNPYGNSVFVLTNNDDNQLSAKQRFIQTGEERGDLVAVTKGLEVGETIASSGLLKLRNGSLVSLNNEMQPEASASPEPHNE